jgi:RNA polymerase sigma-70 factor, ECF subfamily
VKRDPADSEGGATQPAPAGPAAYGALGDAALMRLVVAGDDRALETLHRRYVRPCSALAAKLLRDEEAVREVVQDAFLRLWLARARYDSRRGPLLPWLLAITYRRSVDVVRSQRRHSALPLYERDGSGEALAVVLPATLEGASGIAAAETRVVVRLSIAQLPHHQRVPIELAYFGGLTQQEIARTLDTPLGTIKSHMAKANRRLRQIIDGVDAPPSQPPAGGRATRRAAALAV